MSEYLVFCTNEVLSVASQDGPFNWDRYTQGVILGSFYYGYIITPIPGGRMAELFGGKWLFGIGALITGFLSLLIPYAAYNWGTTALIALRIVQGLGEGVTYPAMEALMAHWLPVGIRTTGLSLVHAGGSVGIVSGMAISGVLADSDIMGGWPSVFYSFGLLTVVWFVFWVLLVSDRPDDHPWISQQEVDLIENDLGDQKPTHVSFWCLRLRSIKSSEDVPSIARDENPSSIFFRQNPHHGGKSSCHPP